MKRFYVRCFILILLVLGNSVILKGGPLPEVPSNPILANNFFVESPESTPINPIYLYRIPHGFVVFEKGRVTYQFIDNLTKKTKDLRELAFGAPELKITNIVTTWKNSLVTQQMIASKELKSSTNYLIGSDERKWKKDVKHYQTLTYENIYNHVDLEYMIIDNQLKYNLILHPGADISNLQLFFEGADQVKVENNEKYVLSAEGHQVVDEMPLAFQETLYGKRKIDLRFNLLENNRLEFKAKSYDKNKDLIIDPFLYFSTFVGGSGTDAVYVGGIDRDVSGNIFLTGRTLSTNFPTTAGTFQINNGGNYDGFIIKMNSSGTALQYCTYFGGSDLDAGYSLKLNQVDGSLWVVGGTYSFNFPSTVGCWQTSFGGNSDGFVLHLNSTGNSIIKSTYFGLANADYGHGLDIDPNGDIYITGETNGNFYTTAGALQTLYGAGTWDGFVAKFPPSLTAPSFSTYLGGNQEDVPLAIRVDPSGNSYVAGWTASLNFSVTPGAFDISYNGGVFDAFVAKLNPLGTALIYSTYIGSSGTDWIWNALSIDASGRAIFAGYGGSGLPTTPGSYNTTYAGGISDVFVSILNPTGSNLDASCLLGGINDDLAYGLSVDPSGNVFVTGICTNGFPYTTCTYDSTFNGGTNDAFVSVLSPDLSQLLFSSYLGGSGDDNGFCIYGYPGHVITAGETYSSNFPTIATSFDPSFNGNSDIYITDIDLTGNIPPVALFSTNATICSSDSVRFTNLSSAGNNYLWLFGDGNSSVLQNPSHYYQSAGTYTVTLIAYGGTCATNDTIIDTITVSTQPLASFTYQASCTGSVNFFNTAANTTANWNFNNLGTANGDTVNFQFNTSGSGIPITLIVQNANGCADTIIQNITIPSVTIAAFTLPDSLCGLAISPLNTSTGTLYNWSFGDNTNSTLGSPTHTYATAGTYTVTLIVDTAACADTLTTQVTLINEPQAVCTFTTDCNLGVSINNQSSNATGYFWNWGNSFTASGLQTNYTYASSGPYQITLVANNAGFCFDTLIQNINIPLNANAAFSLPDSICGLTITPQNNSVGSLFHWDFGDSNTSSLTAPSHTYSASGTYTITLIADTTVCADTLTQLVTLIDNPQATCTFTSDCFLGISLNNLSTNATTYSWDWGDTNSATAVQSNYTYATAGNYLVTLVVGNAGFCYDTLQQNVTVQETPVTNFTYPSPLCVGNVQFTANGTVASTYAWTFGDGGISSVASPMHNYLSAGLFTVQMIASNGVCADTNTVQIQIQPNPVAALSDSSGCDLLHYFQPVGLSPGGNSYQWYFGDGDSSILSSDQHLFASAGVYNVTLIVTSPQGCSDTTISPVNVREKAVAIFTPQVPACGLLVVFSNASTNNSSSAWDFGDGSTSLLNQPSYTYISGGNYTVVLIADTGICSDSASANFTLNENPVADFTFNGGCSDTLLFQNLSTGATGYFWTFGDGDSNASTDPVHIYNAAGNYPVILVASSGAGCTDTITQLLTVNTIPAPVIVAVVDSCKQRVYFSTNVDSLIPVTWIFGDGTTSFGPNVTHEYSDTGIYTVTLILEPNTPCADSAYASITIVPGESTPVFIPNCFTPNNDLINDRFSFGRVASCAIYHLQIYNRWGQKIVDTYDVERGWDGTFNGQDSPEGVYVFLVTGSVEVQGFVTLLR